MQTQPEQDLTQPIEYDGKISELFKIFFLNLFLGIVTLGIYHFWGKTRKRRYLTASYSLHKDRFEYTGTGAELFKGFLKALVVLFLITIPLMWAFSEIDNLGKKMEEIHYNVNAQSQTSHPSSQSPTEPKKIPNPEEMDNIFKKLSPSDQKMFTTTLVIIVAYIVFYYFYLPFVATFGSLKYRASRTRWRGIRAHLRGSSLIYGFVGLFHLVLKICTLGLWIPFADLMTYRYKMNRFAFGSLSAGFTPRYRRLFIYHVLTLMITILVVTASCAAIYYYWPVYFYFTNVPDEITKRFLHQDALFSVALVVFILFFMLIRYWYKALLLKLKYECLHFGEIGFRCDVTGWELLCQLVGNHLITIFTLGLGAPIVTQRRQRFFCRHVKVIGNIEKMMISQNKEAKETGYEGLSSVFDLNIGLF